MTNDFLFLWQQGTPAGQYPGAARQPLDYPGPRPDFSYCYGQGFTLPLSQTTKDEPALLAGTEAISLNTIFSHYGLAAVEDRYLVLAVGSNACPGRLQEKYAECFPQIILPALKGRVTGLDSVYCADLAPYAAIPATCVAAPQTRVELWALLLSRSELAYLNETEGVGEDYDLVETQSVFEYGGWSLSPVYAYQHRKILALDGQLVRLAWFPAENTTWPALEQRQVLTTVLDQLDFHRHLLVEERHRLLWHNDRRRQVIAERIRVEKCWERESLATGPAVSLDQIRPARWLR